MPAKCGHAGATCIVGNYWECKECDTLKLAISLKSLKWEPELDIKRAGAKFEDLFWGIDRTVGLPKAVPQITSTWKADATAQTTAQVTDFLKSIGTPWVDKLRGIATVVDGQTCYTLSHYSVVKILPTYTLDNVKAHVRSVLEYMLFDIEKNCKLVATSRGWRYDTHIATLGQFIHAVSDDGQILRRVDTEDALEMRFRSFYHPLPGKLCP